MYRYLKYNIITALVNYIILIRIVVVYILYTNIMRGTIIALETFSTTFLFYQRT